MPFSVQLDCIITQQMPKRTSATEKLFGCKSGKRFEVVNKMRLVEIAAIICQRR